MRFLKKCMATCLLFLFGYLAVYVSGQGFPVWEFLSERHENPEPGGASGDGETEEGDNGQDAMDSFAKEIKLGYGESGELDIAPFYNISPGDSFVFHFSSKVNPMDAVTVHTDAGCGINSMVYQLNEGYEVGDGMDVVVKPKKAVLGSEDGIWGYAPIYYLSIHYDFTSKEKKKLDSPIVVPFTIRHEVSTPNVSASVDEDGKFFLSWDAIDGAVEYNIYKTKGIGKSGDGVRVKRSECAYIGEKPELIATTDKASFDDFLNNSLAGCKKDNEGYICIQNGASSGNYYVTAVDEDGKESAYSKVLESWEYEGSMPKVFEDHSVFEKDNGIATVLPGKVPIKMCNGTNTWFPISYTLVKEETGYALYEYKIHNTLLTGTVKYKTDGEYKEKIEAEETMSMMNNAKNLIHAIPENWVSVSHNSGYIEVVGEYNGGKKTEFDTSLYQKREEMEKRREGNLGVYGENDNPIGMFLGSSKRTEWKPIALKKDLNNVVDKYGYLLFADSAEEEYMAYCMMMAKHEISIEDFPRLKNIEYLVDVIYKIIYQNPYVIGVQSFSYDIESSIVYIDYTLEEGEIKRQQEEIKKNAEDILSSILKEGMGKEEKVMAIWEYLEDNTTYNQTAYHAMKGNQGGDGFQNAFSAYGILCEKKGVCQSYMYAFKLLCTMSDIECMCLTGYLQNSVPHGWNAVKLGNQWYWVDATNNETNSGVPYFIYQTSSDFAIKSWNYKLDSDFEIDDSLRFAKENDLSHDFYVERGIFANSHDEIVDIIREKLKGKGERLYIKCSFTPDINDRNFMQQVSDILYEKGYSNEEISNAVFGSIDQIVMIEL